MGLSGGMGDNSRALTLKHCATSQITTHLSSQQHELVFEHYSFPQRDQSLALQHPPLHVSIYAPKLPCNLGQLPATPMHHGERNKQELFCDLFRCIFHALLQGWERNQYMIAIAGKDMFKHNPLYRTISCCTFPEILHLQCLWLNEHPG